MLRSASHGSFFWNWKEDPENKAREGNSRGPSLTLPESKTPWDVG